MSLGQKIKVGCATSAALFFLHTLPSPAFAGFQVLSWDLVTGVQDFTGGGAQVGEARHVVMNPFEELVEARIGLNAATVHFDYSWIRDMAFGEFNNDITHVIRTSRIRTITDVDILILPDDPISIAVDGSLTYSHTPGDESEVRFSASVRNITTLEYAFLEIREGGNANLQPSSGTLSFEGEAILEAGQTYRLHYGVTSSNTADFFHPPTGILDAAGFVNFEINPVPESATLSMLLPAVLFLARRRKREITA